MDVCGSHTRHSFFLLHKEYLKTRKLILPATFMKVKLGLTLWKKHRLRVSRRIPEAMKKELMRGFINVLFISIIIIRMIN
jgi:hypothetical protein